jgi:WS/DGAT/MGAT family acyltransferase
VAARVLGRRLAPLDAAFLYLERPEAPLHIGGVSVIDGEVTGEALAARLGSRLEEIPRYRQRVVPAPLGIGHPAWETDPAFDVRRHVIEHQVRRPGEEADLQACAAGVFEGPLARDRPLWELHVLRGLSGGRSAIVSKIHHCMVDGVSGVELMDVVFDGPPGAARARRREPVTVLPPVPPGELLGEGLAEALADALEAARRALDAVASPTETVRAVARRAAAAAGALGRAASAPVARLPFNRPLTGARRLGWLGVPLDEVTAAGRARGGTINDVTLAVLTDAIGRDLAASGFDVAGRCLRVLVPVSLRAADEHGLLGNRVSMVPVEVPFVGTPLDRLDATIACSALVKRTGLAEEVGALVGLAGLAPAWLHAGLLGLAASPRVLAWSAPLRSAAPLVANLVCTNVPGPPVPLLALGHPVLAHYPLVPLGLETGLNCAVMTYNRVLHVGLVADAGAIDELAPLCGHLAAAWDDLRRATGVAPAPAPRRRRPRPRAE